MAPISGSISNFLEAINNQSGMSMSNGYDVNFQLPSALAAKIKTDCDINLAAPSEVSNDKLLTMLCDEAQLPSMQSATGQITGRYLGEAQINYAHTKMYSDFSLGWMLDANLTALKFFNSWYSYIYSGNIGENDAPKTYSGNRLSTIKTVAPKVLNRNIRLNYPKDYMGTVRVTKTERGVNAPNARAGVMYILEDCFPYSIDAIPLAYGTSQITRLTVNFYYAKHTVVYNDISSFNG